MAAVFSSARSSGTAATRIVMLPAAYTGPQDFVGAGFADAVQRRRLDLDLQFVPLEFAHVTDRTVLTRLHELLAPARAAGCALWLGGISLGGYVALCYAERHARELAGLCVFAPYLGSHIVTGEIERAGTLARWCPGELAADDEERRVWRFIRDRAAQPPRLHLGLGREDRFAPRHRLMAAALPPQCVDVVPGGHDWPTWLTLWENFLDANFAGARP